MELKSEFCRGLYFLTYFRTRDKLNSLYDYISKSLPDCPATLFMLDNLSYVLADLEFYFKPIPKDNGKSE